MGYSTRSKLIKEENTQTEIQHWDPPTFQKKLLGNFSLATLYILAVKLYKVCRTPVVGGWGWPHMLTSDAHAYICFDLMAFVGYMVFSPCSQRISSSLYVRGAFKANLNKASRFYTVGLFCIIVATFRLIGYVMCAIIIIVYSAMQPG